jgi:hypothetical protein
MTPNGKNFLALLISLYAEQEGIQITYKTEEVHNEH